MKEQTNGFHLVFFPVSLKTAQTALGGASISILVTNNLDVTGPKTKSGNDKAQHRDGPLTHNGLRVKVLIAPREDRQCHDLSREETISRQPCEFLRSGAGRIASLRSEMSRRARLDKAPPKTRPEVLYQVGAPHHACVRREI